MRRTTGVSDPTCIEHPTRPGGRTCWLVVVALVLAACGGSGDSDDGGRDVTVIGSTTVAEAPTTTAPPTSDGAAEPELVVTGDGETDPDGAAVSGPAPETTDDGSAPDDEDGTDGDAEETSTTTTTDVPGEGNLSVRDRISTVGYGEVFVGMLLDDARQAAGSEFTPQGEVGNQCGFHVADDAPDGVRFLVAFGRIAAIEITNPEIRTRSLLGVGSTVNEITDLFGDRIVEGTDDAGGRQLEFVPEDDNDANQRVIFEIGADDRVTRYRSGQLPEVTYGADCP